MASLVRRVFPGSASITHPGKDVAKAEDEAASHRRGTSLLDLPPELHLIISEQLTYPDALSLRHVNRYFYRLVDTGIELKIDWLVERRRLHLECPNNTRCDLGSDLRFCRGSVKYVVPSHLLSRLHVEAGLVPLRENDHRLLPLHVSNSHSNVPGRLLMKRRREHIECESRPGLGCLIYGTSTCPQRRKLGSRVKRWLRTRLTFEMWWVLLALVPVVLGWALKAWVLG